MLGDVSPQNIRITAQAVVYPGRNHVVRATIEKAVGRRYTQTDLTAITRAVLVFPEADPVIAYDSLTDPVFTFSAGGVLEIDLSDYAMPTSIFESHLVLFDAEHPSGQVIVDNDDTKLVFDFRNVSTTGTTPPPTVNLVEEAPTDGLRYVRQNGTWVALGDVVAAVLSVNGQTGNVVLTAADVGADPAGAAAGAAAGAVAAHEVEVDPHPQYSTDADLAAHVADTTPHETILSLDRIGFSLTPAGPAGAGEVVWNDTDKTLDIGLGGGITLQAGQELQVRGLNNSGATMLNGRAVYISGAQGNRLVFSLADADQITADKTIAVLTQDIPNNQQGQATVIGLVRDIDTSGFAEGNELWLSATTPGLVTNIKPAAPNNAVHIGYVVRSHATLGSIFVRIRAGEALPELHDVVITAPADGHILEYDSGTQTWVNVPNTGGSGEANTASNLGTGVGLYAQKVGVDLQFKSLVAGAGVTLTPSANSIEIVASGAGGAVDSVNGQTGVVVLDTDDVDEGATNLYFTNARASAAAPVQTVDGQTGAVSLSASYAPLSHVGDTGAAHGAATTSVAGFMSAADKTKLNGVATGATANPNTDSLAEGATNLYHTAVRVLATVLNGLSLATGGAITSADTVLVAFGKLQKQITDLITTVGGKQNTLVSGTNIKTINGNSLLGSGNLSISGSGTDWGGIGGTLADQTDLQAALDAKAMIAGLPSRDVTTSGAVTPADAGHWIICDSATPITLTIGAEATASWAVPGVLPCFHVMQIGAGGVTVAGDGFSLVLHSQDTAVLNGPGSVATAVRLGPDVWRLFGDLVPV